MNSIPETNLTLEQVLPAYFKLTQELEESRKVARDFVELWEKTNASRCSLQQKYENLREEIEELLYDYENTHCYDEEEIVSKFLDIARKHCR